MFSVGLVSRTLRPSTQRILPIRLACAPFSTSRSIMSVKAIQSLDEFKTLINSDTPVIVDFWATWCGPCKIISPLFEKFAADTPAEQASFYKVDVDEQEAIAGEVGVTAMPTFIVFKGGQKIEQTVGAVPQALQAMIKKVTS